MKPYLFLLLAVLTGCMPRHARKEPNPNEKFAALADEFINGYLAWRPQTATTLGLHQYDGKVTDFSQPSLAAELARLKRFDMLLAGLDSHALQSPARFDCRILQTAIKSELFQFEDIEAYTKNPMVYAQAIDLNLYIKRDFAPLQDRLKSIVAIERQVPRVLAAARANLAESLPKPYVETAIQIANGVADFLEKDLFEPVQTVNDKNLLAEFQTVNREAMIEFRAYADYLQKQKLPKAHLRYALGRDKFQKMLCDQEGIVLPPEKILAIGLQQLQLEQQLFAEAARQIDPTRKPIEVFKEIQKDHPTEQTLVPETKKNLEAIRQFLVQHKIITLPSRVRPRVEETPRFNRATSFASMDTPGPFESKATEAYYYVTPVEKDWPPQQKEEWLTAFNYYTTDVVSTHEVYPGHYVQFLHLNASGATRLEKIFTGYAFIEGWAHYAEQMMIEQGFGGQGAASPGDAVRRAKFHLAQSDEALLRLCRLCVSIKTHCEGMSLEDATRFFEENCYYEHKPAYQEALRGTFDPGYLYYSLGKLAFLKLRRDYQLQEGPRFSLQKFHDEVLRHGAPPLRLLREALLKDPAQWDQLF